MQPHDLAGLIANRAQELSALMISYQRPSMTSKRSVLLNGADVLVSRLVIDITALRKQYEAERERG